jgi:hypothetical protein
MFSLIRNVHPRPVGIAGLCATVAITVALIGPRAPFAVSSAGSPGDPDYRGGQDFRAAEGLVTRAPAAAAIVVAATPASSAGAGWAPQFSGRQDLAH